MYKGYTSKLIYSLCPDKTHYCYDTFCGIIGSNNKYDIHIDRGFKCSLDIVKQNINMDNKVGVFPDIFEENDEKFIFVHSDADTYIGTKETILKLKDRIVKGGKIVFDDYKWRCCPGVEIALHKFKETDNEFIHKPLSDTN